MIYSNVPQLRLDKEQREGRKLTFAILRKETGLSNDALTNMLGLEPLKRVDTGTMEALCTYFQVGIGDILRLVPNVAGGVAGGDSVTGSKETEVAA